VLTKSYIVFGFHNFVSQVRQSDFQVNCGVLIMGGISATGPLKYRLVSTNQIVARTVGLAAF
jgi:hypothetical protein